MIGLLLIKLILLRQTLSLIGIFDRNIIIRSKIIFFSWGMSIWVILVLVRVIVSWHCAVLLVWALLMVRRLSIVLLKISTHILVPSTILISAVVISFKITHSLYNYINILCCQIKIKLQIFF